MPAALFSHRLPWPCPTNRLSRLLQQKRSRGGPILDLTESNPTRVGLDYPVAQIAAALADPGSASYDPHPCGLPAAREAIAADHARRGVRVTPDRIILTAGTGEAYSLIFKLLADPGQTVLVPRPGYPLFDYLVGLESLRVAHYPMSFDGRWWIDPVALDHAAAADGRGNVRAVVLINPHNPTGAALRSAERASVERVCAARGMSVIADEVFLDYLDEETGRAGRPEADRIVSMAGHADPGRAPVGLTFTLGGLSKSCGLPQMKLGWIVVDGPDERRREALERLEIIADTYLSVGTPVQRATARLLALGGGIRDAIRARLRANRAALAAAVRPDSPCRVLPGDGGWYAVLQVPATLPEEDLVLRLLDEDDVLVHPGYFFDFEREAFLILSLLPTPDTFSRALDRILGRVTPSRVSS